MRVIRHLYDVKNNDVHTPLCHSLMTGGALIRLIAANVDCPDCLDLFQRMQEEDA